MDQEDADDDDDDVADLVLQAIRILAYRSANRCTHSFFDSTDEEARRFTVSYPSYSRLLPMRRSNRTSDAIKRAIRSALRAMPEPARVPPAELFDTLNRRALNARSRIVSLGLVGKRARPNLYRAPSPSPSPCPIRLCVHVSYSDQCNVLGVLGACGRSVGLASCLGAIHLFNHSCLPNAAFDSIPTKPGVVIRPTMTTTGTARPVHAASTSPATAAADIGRPPAMVDAGAHGAARDEGPAFTAVTWCDGDAGPEPEDASSAAEFEFAAFALRALVDIEEGEEICHCCAHVAQIAPCHKPKGFAQMHKHTRTHAHTHTRTRTHARTHASVSAHIARRSYVVQTRVAPRDRRSGYST